MKTQKISVVINGLPDKKARAVAEAVASSSDMILRPFGLTEPETIIMNTIVCGEPFEFFSLGEELLFREMFELYGKPDIIIDFFSSPETVKRNVDFYIRHRLPFVMAKLGVDPDYVKAKVAETKNKGGIFNAVVASYQTKETLESEFKVDNVISAVRYLYEVQDCLLANGEVFFILDVLEKEIKSNLKM